MGKRDMEKMIRSPPPHPKKKMPARKSREAREVMMSELMHTGQIHDPDVFHYITKAWLYVFLEKFHITFRKRDTKLQLWEKVQALSSSKHSSKSSLKSFSKSSSKQS